MNSTPLQHEEEHPFRAAFRSRDIETWSSHFAPDIKLYSPLLTSTFEGADTAAELYEVLFAVLEDFEIVFSAHEQSIDAFHWRCTAGGRSIEGLDLISHNENGSIGEIRVMIRTLPSLAAFALAVGPPLARRRSRLRGVIAYGLTYPLKPLFAAVDALAPRLTQRKPR